MKKYLSVDRLLFTVAGMEAMAGTLITGGCLCEPNFKVVGFLVACTLGVFVVGVIVLGILARRRPRTAVVLAVLLECGVLIMMAHPIILAAAPAWWGQAPVLLVLSVAVMSAFLGRS